MTTQEQTSTDLWRTICDEARAAVAIDPVLGTSMAAAIFDHGDLGEAVAYQIGKRLGATTGERARFTRVAREAFLASPELVEAAGRDLRGIYLSDNLQSGSPDNAILRVDLWSPMGWEWGMPWHPDQV